jgi:hypothetical protein
MFYISNKSKSNNNNNNNNINNNNINININNNNKILYDNKHDLEDSFRSNYVGFTLCSWAVKTDASKKKTKCYRDSCFMSYSYSYSNGGYSL